MRKKLLVVLGALALSLVIFITAVSAQAPNVELKNEFIRIVVNNRENNKGRFAVGTTGGDPNRDTDRNKHLIYGGDDPWTSYTTIRVDNENWVYGSPTERRAGFDGKYGEMIEPPMIVDGAIRSCWRMGPIQAWQILSITRGSTTGLLDTARIEYHIENIDSLTHFVSLRLMLDTMLGSNDGAPFLVENRQLTSDTVYYRRDMPEYWQAFDSLDDPQVISQGTLLGPDATTPDRVYFTNWGSLADSTWQFDFEDGREFTRLGEFDLDSAIAIYWDHQPLGPGESRSYVSYYGLGGVTIVPGKLTVGLTSPKQITADPDSTETFSIISYVQNTGQGEALDVEAELKLPRGLQLVGGSAKISLEDLDVGEMKQTGWQVRADGRADGLLTYEVGVTATNSEPNRASERIRVLSPAKLEVQFDGPPALKIRDGKYDPAVFEARAIVRNSGGAPSHGSVFEILHPFGLGLVKGQSPKKFPGIIEPGEELSFTWSLQPIGGVSGNVYYSLRITPEKGSPQIINASISVPELMPTVRVGKPEFKGEALKAGDYFQVPVWAANVHGFSQAELDLSFDPELLEITAKTLDISRGTLFLDENSSWQMPQIFNDTGQVIGLKGERGDPTEYAYGTLLTIHFRAKKPGLAAINLDRVIIRGPLAGVMDCAVEHGKILIQPQK